MDIWMYVYERGYASTADVTMCQECQTRRIQFTTELIVCQSVSEWATHFVIMMTICLYIICFEYRTIYIILNVNKIDTHGYIINYVYLHNVYASNERRIDLYNN